MLINLTTYALLIACFPAYSQEKISTLHKIADFPFRFFDQLEKNATNLEKKLIKHSSLCVKKLARQEAQLKKRLRKKDSLAAEQVFGNIRERYQQMQDQLVKTDQLVTQDKEYLPHLDSLKTALHFLSVDHHLLPGGQEQAGKLRHTLNNLKRLEGKLAQTEQIKNYFRERKQQLHDRLSQFGFSKELNRFSKAVYYYSQQLNECRTLLNDPKKLEQKVLGLVQKIPAFQQFFKEHSQLAGLFRLPDHHGSIGSLQGLQSRAEVQDLIQQLLAAGGPNALAMLQQPIQQAQIQLSQLKDRINKFGNMPGAADDAIPEFKPNHQKTKTFLQRLEYGTNIQNTSSNAFFPTTTDLGLSVGYKITDNSIIGIGTSYKVGWGKDLRHIHLTSEGVGLRSFADVKLKGNFFATCGFEYNYQQPFSFLQQINDPEQWQQSGLAGISKIVSLKDKTFRKTKLQLLWDFLSYQQVPRTQAIKFRVGYSF